VVKKAVPLATTFNRGKLSAIHVAATSLAHIALLSQNILTSNSQYALEIKRCINANKTSSSTVEITAWVLDTTPQEM
jgi:hypothetical protein